MKVLTPQIIEKEGTATVRARLESEDPRADGFTIEYRFLDRSADELDVRGDSFLAACLLPAMALGEDLDLGNLEVSPKFLNGAADLIEIYADWVPGAKRIRVDAPRVASNTGGEGTGLFFSCGVDSFYSLLKDIDVNPPNGAITHLIFVRGFQYFEMDHDLWPKVLQRLSLVATETGKQLVVAETNMRTLTDHIVKHYMYNPGDTVSAAMALAPSMGKIQISSSVAMRNLIPHGFHPVIDPLWSTDAVEFVHVGAEHSRFGKIVSRVASSDLAMDNLIICMEHPRTELNCGRCGKCVRSRLTMAQAGVLERCSTLPHELDTSMLAHIKVGVLPYVYEASKDPRRIPLPGDLEEAFQQRIRHVEKSVHLDHFRRLARSRYRRTKTFLRRLPKRTARKLLIVLGLSRRR